MWTSIGEFFKKSYPFIIEGFLIFIILYVAVRYSAKNKKAFNFFILYIVLLGILYLTYRFEFKLAYNIYKYVCIAYPIVIIVLLAPDIRKNLNAIHKPETKMEQLMSSNDKTKTEIVDACMYLSSKKIGALITIEKHNSLDQYAQKAILLDSEVSKELLINIFTPLTPLHDGAVIIRGNRIRCAGAYYVLTTHEDLDKTTGSRHRAGLGISEVTDSLTIICSEETGNISIAIEGMMIKINDREKLVEYLELFLK